MHQVGGQLAYMTHKSSSIGCKMGIHSGDVWHTWVSLSSLSTLITVGFGYTFLGWLLLGSLNPVCQDGDTSGWMLTYLDLGILRDASSFLFRAYYCHSLTLKSCKVGFCLCHDLWGCCPCAWLGFCGLGTIFWLCHGGRWFSPGSYESGQNSG